MSNVKWADEVWLATLLYAIFTIGRQSDRQMSRWSMLNNPTICSFHNWDAKQPVLSHKIPSTFVFHVRFLRFRLLEQQKFLFLLLQKVIFFVSFGVFCAWLWFCLLYMWDLCWDMWRRVEKITVQIGILHLVHFFAN